MMFMMQILITWSGLFFVSSLHNTCASLCGALSSIWYDFIIVSLHASAELSTYKPIIIHLEYLTPYKHDRAAQTRRRRPNVVGGGDRALGFANSHNNNINIH